MGLFSANPARREARLERQIARKTSKLTEVRQQIPGQAASAALAPKFNQPNQSTAGALSELKDYVIELDRKQQMQIDALDDDIGRAVQKLKRTSASGGAGFGGDGMGGLLLVLALSGGLGTSSSSSSSSSSNNLLLILLLAGGLGGDDGGGMGMMGLILLLALL